MVKWFKNKSSEKKDPLLAGILLGIAIFTRTNNVIVLFAVIAFVIIVMRKNIKIGFRQVGILLIAVLIVIGPWIIYNQINYGRDPLTWKIQEAIKNRFFKSNTRGFNEIDLGSKTVQVEIQPRYLESNSNQSISSLNAYDFNNPEIVCFQ